MSTKVKVYVSTEDNKLHVFAPFLQKFVVEAKKFGGIWSRTSKEWIFDTRDEEYIKKACFDLFGSDGSSSKLVDIKITFLKGVLNYQDAVYICNRQIAYATGRDSGAKIGEGVKLLTGEIDSGGSTKNWFTTIEKDTVLIMRDVYEAAVEKELVKIDEAEVKRIKIELISEHVDVDALKDEKEKLLKRLQEIDETLSKV